MKEASAAYSALVEDAAGEALPVGYKRTEVGVIPADWDVVSLYEIGEPLIGLTYAPADVADDGVLVLRSSNVQAGSLCFYDNIFVTCAVPDRIMVKRGDILICVRNGSRDLIGKCALIDDSAMGMTFGAFMAVFRTSASGFIFQQFRSSLIQRQIREHLGATINQITNRSLRSFVTPLPASKAEQQTITEALSDADALIVSLEQLVTKKRQIKQGAMQALLTGKKRLPGFSGEWRMKRLGELGAFTKGSGVRKDQSQSGVLPCIRYGEIYTHHNDCIRSYLSWISPAVAETATRLRKGDVLFAGSGETKEEIGKCVAFTDDIEAYAGGDIVILRGADADSMFLGYYLNTAPINAKKASKGQGDAVVHISASALGGIATCLPAREEQTAIATLLSDMDVEIDNLEARLTKARQLKQGMMQVLLTGGIRLNYGAAGR